VPDSKINHYGIYGLPIDVLNKIDGVEFSTCTNAEG
jgi:hypothetical protein